jgi:hypothetical protein
VAAVQYILVFTHRQYTEYITTKEIGKCGPCPVFASYTLEFALQLQKTHGKTSVRVVEKFPDIPVATAFRNFADALGNLQSNVS